MMWREKEIRLYNKGNVILGIYLVEDIRSGAMGKVYIAEHKMWKFISYKAKLAAKLLGHDMTSTPITWRATRANDAIAFE